MSLKPGSAATGLQACQFKLKAKQLIIRQKFPHFPKSNSNHLIKNTLHSLFIVISLIKRIKGSIIEAIEVDSSIDFKSIVGCHLFIALNTCCCYTRIRCKIYKKLTTYVNRFNQFSNQYGHKSDLLKQVSDMSMTELVNRHFVIWVYQSKLK